MTFSKLITLSILAVCGAYAQTPPTIEQLKSLTGSRVTIRTKSEKSEGRLEQVTPEQVVMESFDSKHSRTQVRVLDIQSINELHFRGSRTDLILLKSGRAAKAVPVVALAIPALILAVPGTALLHPERF